MHGRLASLKFQTHNRTSGSLDAPPSPLSFRSQRSGTGAAGARYAPAKTSPQRKAYIMLKWALIFFIVSIIAGVFGFTGISAATAGIARILFFLFLVIFLVFLVMSLMAGNAIL
jgi:uncharacterized membrane protein YtjA (UPF0391 family)